MTRKIPRKHKAFENQYDQETITKLTKLLNFAQILKLSNIQNMISQFGSEICLEPKIYYFVSNKSVNEVRRTICDVINIVSNTCELETEAKKYINTIYYYTMIHKACG